MFFLNEPPHFNREPDNDCAANGGFRRDDTVHLKVPHGVSTINSEFSLHAKSFKIFFLPLRL